MDWADKTQNLHDLVVQLQATVDLLHRHLQGGVLALPLNRELQREIRILREMVEQFTQREMEDQELGEG